MARLKVELLVCPHCRHVGKLPHLHGLKGFCVGSVQHGTAHTKVRMVSVSFSGKAPELVEVSG
jgi:hypothetical protein